MAWSYLQKIQNQLEAKRSKRNSGGLCGCHTLSQTFIIVNWEIQQTCMLCKPNMSSQICCTKVCLDGHSNILDLVPMRFSILRYVGELVTQFFCLWTMIHSILRHFMGNVVVHYFTPNVTSWKQPCDLGVIAIVKKWSKFLFLKDVLSFCKLGSANQHIPKEGSKFRRASVDVSHDRTVALLDAAN